MPEKSFDPVTGEVFPGMGQAQRETGSALDVSPEVFVIGGAGDGIPVYNRLCRQNIPFATGILQENDVEFAAAQALATEVVWEKAFYPVTAETEERAKQIIDRCKTCICAVKTFGTLNEVNKRLLLYAKEKGKLAESRETDRK